MFALCHAKVLIDGRFAEDAAVVVDGARIAAVVPHADIPAAAERVDLAGAMLAPGFIDTQVNGGGDVLFNDSPTVETIRRIGEAHARFGTTGFLPTLISDDLHVIRAGIEAVDEAIAIGVPGVLGIHIEGPYINVARKGIHDERKIRPIDEEGMAVLTSLRRGRSLVTLAPELAGEAVIRRLTDAGMVVAAGHTAGTYEEVTAGVAAGLTGFTHLFNAMSQLGNRDPGAVGAALASDDVWCSLIVDGIHVSPVTLRLALRCKPADRFVLVSDAMPVTGGAEASFMLGGRRIRAEHGRLVDDEGTLAGADLDMRSAVFNAHRLLELPLPTALAAASANPARFLSLEAELGSIAPGKRASLVAIMPDGALVAGWIDGKRST